MGCVWNQLNEYEEAISCFKKSWDPLNKIYIEANLQHKNTESLNKYLHSNASKYLNYSQALLNQALQYKKKLSSYYDDNDFANTLALAESKIGACRKSYSKFGYTEIELLAIIISVRIKIELKRYKHAISELSKI